MKPTDNENLASSSRTPHLEIEIRIKPINFATTWLTLSQISDFINHDVIIPDVISRHRKSIKQTSFASHERAQKRVVLHNKDKNELNIDVLKSC